MKMNFSNHYTFSHQSNKTKKMEDNNVIREYAQFRKINVCCRRCNVVLSEFKNYEKCLSRKLWKTKLTDIFVIERLRIGRGLASRWISGLDILTCQCNNVVGFMHGEERVIIYKESVALKY